MTLDRRDLAAVAMFPLPNVVLLPGSIMPLHIFEARYRDMARDVLAGSRLLAMARLHDHRAPDDHGRPAVHATVGVGRIIASDHMDDGRYNLLVRGLIRAHIAQEWPPDHSYRMIQVHPVADAPDEHPHIAAATQTKLIDICDQIAALMDEGGEQLRALARDESTPGGCADLVASALVSDADERQVLLETCSPTERLERVIRYLSEQLLSLGNDGSGMLN